MDAAEPSLPQQALVEQFATRRDLQRELLFQSTMRIARVRRVVGADSLPDLTTLAQSSLAFGVYRALLIRFAAEQGLTHEWWVEQRRRYGRNGKDRQQDLDIILLTHPEFAFYTPTDALTDSEVIRAAKIELRDHLAAPGTTFHEQEVWQRHRTTGTTIPQTYHTSRQSGPSRPANPTSTIDTGEWDIVDEKAHQHVENFVLRRLEEDDQHLLGPAVTHAARIALREYGPSGLYWLVEWLFLPKKYTELLRVMGQTEEALGTRKFEAIKRDLIRKLPQMHERMMALLRDDPDIQHLRDVLLPPQPKALALVPSPVPDNTYALERSRFLRRKHEAMVNWIAADPELAAFLPISNASPTTLTPLLEAFLAAEHDSSRWGAFRGLVKKLAAQEAA